MPHMKITSTQQAGICIISIVGRVDSLTSDETGKFLEDQIAQGKVRLIVDLSQVDYMSSSGLRVLMNTLKSTRQQKGDLYLAGLQENIRQLLDLAGFTSIFKIYSTLPNATAAFV
jgi:anti-sigma B factor antagonist